MQVDVLRSSARTQHLRRRDSASSAVALCVGLILAGLHLGGDPWTILALVVVNAVAERSGVWITRTTEMSIALLPTLFAAVLFGPLAAGLVNAASSSGDRELFAAVRPRARAATQVASYTSSRFLTGAAAGLVAQWLLEVTSSELRWH